MTEPQKTLVCTCKNSGNEAEMTIRCEEVVIDEKPSPTAFMPEQGQQRLVWTQGGDEADMIIDLSQLTKAKGEQLGRSPLPELTPEGG